MDGLTSLIDRGASLGISITKRKVGLRDVYDLDTSGCNTLEHSDDCPVRQFTLSHLKVVDVFLSAIERGLTYDHPAKLPAREVSFTLDEIHEMAGSQFSNPPDDEKDDFIGSDGKPFQRRRKARVGSERQSRLVFYRAAWELCRWWMESFQYIRVEGGAMSLAAFTHHQETLHNSFVDYWFIMQKQLIAVVAKHRRAYVTTYWQRLLHARARLCPGSHSLFSANIQDTTDELVSDMILSFEAYLLPVENILKAPPYNLPRYGKDNPSFLQFFGLQEHRVRDGATGQERIEEVESPKYGSVVKFMTASGRTGGIGGAKEMIVFSEAGMDGPDWDTITNQSAEALPKKGPSLLVYEGTGEHGGSFLNSLISLAEKPNSGHKLFFLCWLDDPAQRLPLAPGETQVTPLEHCQGGRQRDAEELHRIRTEFKRRVGFDKIEDPTQRLELLKRCEESLNWRKHQGMPRLKFNPLAFNMNHPTTVDDQRTTVAESVFDGYLVAELDKEFERRRALIPEGSDFPHIYPHLFNENQMPVETLHILHPRNPMMWTLVCVDPSQGTNPSSGDPSAIGCWGFLRDGSVTLLAIHDGRIPVSAQARVAMLLSKMYRSVDGSMAMISVETVDKWGQGVVREIMDMGHRSGEMPKLYHMTGALLTDVDREPGFRMDANTKNTSIQIMAEWLPMWIVDYKGFFQQAARFTKLNLNRAIVRGAKGSPDDIVTMSLQAAYIGSGMGFFRSRRIETDELPADEKLTVLVPDKPPEPPRRRTGWDEFMDEVSKHRSRAFGEEALWDDILDPVRG